MFNECDTVDRQTLTLLAASTKDFALVKGVVWRGSLGLVRRVHVDSVIQEKMF